ncbi:MAG: hypothetical protein HOP15_00700 [Planctomycetes bacterium]|nr:hypothetical protein [Planctomycetota bacterium]
MKVLAALRPLVLALQLCLSSCATTGIADSWVDPELTALPCFEQVFVAYLGGDAAAQRVAEDAMAAQLATSAPATRTVKCYELYPDAREVDPASIRAELRAAGCDGAAILHLARIEQQLSSSPGVYPSYHRSFGRYWGWAHAPPAEVRTDEIVHVVTSVHSLVEDKLLYSARSETFNPRSTAAMVAEIAAAIRADLRERGLLR